MLENAGMETLKRLESDVPLWMALAEQLFDRLKKGNKVKITIEVVEEEANE